MCHSRGENRKQCDMLIKALNLLSFRISRGLEYMEGDAMKNHTPVDFEGVVLDRHAEYGRDHPYRLIRPFLDPTRLHIYFDSFPGLCELAFGL